jgi:molybdopterin-guanine dinucleotide biosynthesis protein A
MNVTGAILAGGRSTRMGEPKHSMRLPDGRTMIEHVAEGLRSVCRGMVIVGGPESPRHAWTHVSVRDLRPDCGPLGGIEALLASGIDEQYMVVPCDVPLMSGDVLELLISANPQAVAVVFRREGEDEFDPLPARIAASALPVGRELLDRGRRGVHELMRVLDAHEVVLPRSLQAALTNVNTPSEFAAAGRLLNSERATQR